MIQHPHTYFIVKIAVKGHLAWCAQRATGNRGDDIRSLKLAELQPHIITHPNQDTKIDAVVGCQSEEKAGKRGMKTVSISPLISYKWRFGSDTNFQVINPVYSTMIAHRDPTVCPLGALAIYFHWLFDHYQLTEKREIDWSLNKSWRSVRAITYSLQLSGPILLTVSCPLRKFALSAV